MKRIMNNLNANRLLQAITLYLLFTIPGCTLHFSKSESLSAIGVNMIGTGISVLLLYALVEVYRDKREEDFKKQLLDEIKNLTPKPEEKSEKSLRKNTNGIYHNGFFLFGIALICGAAWTALINARKRNN